MTYPLSNARGLFPRLFAIHYAERFTLAFGAISQLPICKEGAGCKPALPDYSLRHANRSGRREYSFSLGRPE